MRLLLSTALVAAALALAGGAAAAPGFAVYDLRLDLAHASHNPFGDVKVWRRRDALARRAPGAVLVRCAAGCPFAAGWFAFALPPRLRGSDLAGASAARTGKGPFWTLTLRLTRSGDARWRPLATLLRQRERQRGVPDVLVVVARGRVVAAPFANVVRAGEGTLAIPGLRRADALRAAKLLR